MGELDFYIFFRVGWQQGLEVELSMHSNSGLSYFLVAANSDVKWDNQALLATLRAQTYA